MVISILPATEADAVRLAPLLRAADLAECIAAGCLDGLSALTDAVANSTEAWAVYFDREIAALLGVNPLADGVTLLWALTGRVVERFRLSYVRLSRSALRELRQRHAVLGNYVDANYQGALDWLECLGFTIGPVIPHPKTGAPFRLVSIRGL